MDAKWQRIEAWLAKRAPKSASRLRPGASAEALASLEQALGLTLPAALRASLARHDGDTSSVEATVEQEFIAELSLLGTDGILEAWRLAESFWADSPEGEAAQIETDGPVKQLPWNPKWIPFTSIGAGGTHDCIDLDPAEGGTVGQVIRYAEEDQLREVIAPSYEAWLEALAEAFEEGAFKRDGEVLVEA